MKKILACGLLILSATACQNNGIKSATANKTVSEAENAAVIQTTPTVNLSAIKTGQGTGIVTKINQEIGSVELNHGEIKGMMPAMQMEFYVGDKKELESLKVGDKVTFTLEDNQGSEKITKIARAE